GVHADESHRLDREASLLPRLADDRVSRRLVRLQGTAGCDPDPTVAVAYQEQPGRVVEDGRRDRRHDQQLVTEPLAEAGEVLGDRHRLFLSTRSAPGTSTFDVRSRDRRHGSTQAMPGSRGRDSVGTRPAACPRTLVKQGNAVYGPIGSEDCS